MKKRILIFSLMLLSLPLMVYAQQLSNPLGTTDIRVIIGRLIRALLGISGAIALLMFVWGGYQWILSGGEPGKIEKGKNTLKWAIIGLVIIFTSYTLVSMLINTLVSGSVE